MNLYIYLLIDLSFCVRMYPHIFRYIDTLQLDNESFISVSIYLSIYNESIYLSLALSIYLCSDPSIYMSIATSTNKVCVC